ncbi:MULTISPECIES: hypothetical protein [Streptomyces]|uniref:Uncharacterized protein n=1 Tax=Streptomyces fradiae ATCC 10745 = DSM 40063 TaxID=1319510 RepID=A0A1Y2P3D6_STRFR|nr:MULTISPECIES: hypothetical protein [Streptomyces]KAF0646599.1 hypothetical protein K701_28020 [Streptomyces fradiae ATCC 10745 = DSM 40063]OSY54274.1 hypothetical protein BG846_00043 [Streptomyces fradiae ATCC 10745 = DSM 40063]
MPLYRVQATLKTFPQLGDWTTILETEDRDRARAATNTFDGRPYPNRTYWQRLLEDDAVIMVRKPIKPRITYMGRDASGVQRWWVTYADKDGFGGSHGAHGPLSAVVGDLMQSHRWYIERHRVALT